MATTVFQLPGTFTGNPALQRRRNYQDLITRHPLYSGAWIPSDPDYREDVGGNVRRFRDWRPGGAHHLSQPIMARQVATPVLDPVHGRVVANFSGDGAARYYDLEGASFAAELAWSMMVVCKPADYALGSVIVGAADDGEDRAYLQATRRASDSKPIIKGFFGDATVQTVEAVDPDRWHAIILAYDGTSNIIKLQVDRLEPVTSLVSSFEPMIVDALGLGSSAPRYVGKWSFFGLLADDVFSAANDEYRAIANEFMATLVKPAD